MGGEEGGGVRRERTNRSSALQTVNGACRSILMWTKPAEMNRALTSLVWRKQREK